MAEHDKSFQAPASEHPASKPGPRDEHGHSKPPHDEHSQSGHDMGHHVGQYVKVFVALCVLTMMSFFTYSDYWPFHETPSVGWAFMMCVSCCKALLVMLFFMHLKYEADWKYVLTIPASIMSVFLALALVPDVGMRINGSYGYGYAESRRTNIATPETEKVLIKESLIEQERHKHGGDSHGSEKGAAQGGSH
jgi:cytochrome c oxidase subunit IV